MGSSSMVGLAQDPVVEQVALECLTSTAKPDAMVRAVGILEPAEPRRQGASAL